MPTFSTTAVWYGTTGTSGTTTTAAVSFNNNAKWSNELKCMKDVVIKHEIYNPPKPEVKVPKPKAQKKNEENIPLGARMPNIHADEILWGQNHVRHNWCGSGGQISAQYPGHKPFCYRCKRFLSKKAVRYLREHEEEGAYVAELVADLSFGLIMAYKVAQEEKPNEDNAFEAPLSERVDGSEPSTW